MNQWMNEWRERIKSQQPNTERVCIFRFPFPGKFCFLFYFSHLPFLSYCSTISPISMEILSPSLFSTKKKKSSLSLSSILIFFLNSKNWENSVKGERKMYFPRNQFNKKMVKVPNRYPVTLPFLRKTNTTIITQYIIKIKLNCKRKYSLWSFPIILG